MARALIRGSKIVILDEATSNVDVFSDALMQRIIREHFADCTILAVAHRLETIIDFDRIAVIRSGQLIEFDTPEALLSRDSAFKELQRLDQYVRMLMPDDRSSSLTKFNRAVKRVIQYDSKIESSMTKLHGYLDTLTFYQSSIAAGKTNEILEQIRTVRQGKYISSRSDDLSGCIPATV